MQSLDIRRAAHPGESLGWLVAALLLSGGGAAADTADPAAIARSLVAVQVGVPEAEVRILGVTARAFADGSLDCPVPGMAYAQVITPGHQVSAEAAGRRFDLRVAGSSGRICHGKSGAGPRPGQAARPDPAAAAVPPAGTVADRAGSGLASLLGIPPDAVTVLAMRPRGAKEALPACGAAPPEAGDGILVLGADGRQYTYLVRGGLATPCPPVATR